VIVMLHWIRQLFLAILLALSILWSAPFFMPAAYGDAGIVNITIYNNADFSQLLTVTDESGNPINFTGYSAKMAIANTAPPGTTYWTLSSSGDSPEITFPNPVQGQIQLLIPESITKGFTFSSGVYDLLLFAPGGGVNKLLHGTVTVVPGVTPGG
jgi:hypothetical protein